MRRFPRTVALYTLVALSVMVGGCDSERLAAPQAGESVQALKTMPYVRLGGRQVLYGATDASYDEEIDARLRARNGSDQLMVLRDGGVVVAALYVQPGTVKPGTRFTMNLTSEPATLEHAGEFRVDLTATSPSSPTVNDVGAKGFRKPVYLYINVGYLELKGFTPGQLKVAEARDNATLVPTRSWLMGDFLVGQLAHFSGWVPIAD